MMKDVTFNVSCENLMEGESLHIIGNSDELGNWDNENTKQLEKKENSFFVLKLSVDSNSTLIYKYLIKKDGFIQKWEIENRTIKLDSNQQEIKDTVETQMNADCKFGQYLIKLNLNDIKTNLESKNIQIEINPSKTTFATFSGNLCDLFNKDFSQMNFKLIFLEEKK
jgi:hypothetical protein